MMQMNFHIEPPIQTVATELHCVFPEPPIFNHSRAVAAEAILTTRFPAVAVTFEDGLPE